MPNNATPRVHAQTLAELNHCAGTARRDAAYVCLCQLAEREEWHGGRTERMTIYRRCLALAEEVFLITERSSLMHSNTKQMLWDKPVLHFLRMLQELFQSLASLAEHVENVKQEADVLAEHLGEETLNLLETTCIDFEEYEATTQKAMKGTLMVGKNLLESNTAKRRETFTEDNTRRYDKAFHEYKDYYKNFDENSRNG